MKAKVFTAAGDSKSTKTLPANIFEIKVSDNLLHEAVVRHFSNSRQNLAKTKTRGEVRGGGKKPWRQKGTGRARQGSTRSPQWRGGGVVFGPTGEENYTKKMNRKMRQKAVFGALSKKAAAGEILLLEKLELEKPSTKKIADLILKLPIERNLLLVLPGKSFSIEKSAANLPNVKTISVDFLNVPDILKFEKIVFLENSFDKLISAK